MKRILILYLLMLPVFSGSPAAAQTDSDSVVFVNTRWEKRKIARGVNWKHYEFKNTLFSSNQSVNILEVTNSRKDFDLGYEKQILKLTSDFGKNAKAIAALNGTFFDVKNGGAVDFIKANGEVINENRLDQNGKRTHHQKAAIGIQNGKLYIAKGDETADWEKYLPGDDIMVSGPLLLFNGALEKLDSTGFAKNRHPRTAVALTKSKVLLITIDGRHENAAGMNLFELGKILKWLGTDDGINLDGGGSTTLWISNQPENGVVNYPCDNKQWDHAGERKVANVLLVKSK